MLHTKNTDFEAPLFSALQSPITFSLLGPNVLHNTLFLGHAMAPAVSRWLVTAEAGVKSQVSTCRIRGGQNGTLTGFLPVNFIPTVLHYSEIH
jgi:hypothetical protein